MMVAGSIKNIIMGSKKMISEVDYSNKSNCFVYRKTNDTTAHIIKITPIDKNEKPFYTISKPDPECKENVVKINKKLANYHHLERNDNVKVDFVDKTKVNEVKEVLVRITEEDHKKTETCKERLMDTILKQVHCVCVGHKIPLWINKNTIITFDIVKLDPPSEIGIMVTGTEIKFEITATPRPVPEKFDTMFMSLFSNYFNPVSVEINFDDVDIRPKYVRVCSLGADLSNGLSHGSKTDYCVFVHPKSKTHRVLRISQDAKFLFDQLNFKTDPETSLKFVGEIIELGKDSNVPAQNEKTLIDSDVENSAEDMLEVYMDEKLMSKLNIKVGAKFELSKDNENQFLPDTNVENVTTENEGFDQEKLFLDHLDSTLLALVRRTQHSLRNGHLYRDNILLWGPEGCGKTTMCRTLQDRLQNAGMQSVNCELIDCSPMKGKISNVIEKQLRDILSRACYMEPACVILDQVDVLCCYTKESQDMAYVIQSHKICSLFVSVVREFQMNNNILIIGVTNNKDILKSTKASLVFSHTYSLPALDQSNRILLIQKLLQVKLAAVSVDINPADLNKVSQKCEGYSIQDICDIVDKAVFHYVHNMIDDPSFGIANSPPKAFSRQDLEESLQSHVPLALKGINVDPVETTNFSHVGGLKGAKQLLIETLVWPSMYPELFSQCPLKPQSGILLYGAPGTGKTLLASAISGECGLKFISINGPELFSKFIGESEEGVRNIFNRARSIQPCILFFDEFDSLAAKRGNDSTGVKDRVVNQLLTELDGVEGLEGVYVVGATSRPDIIDPALLRPGRLGTAIHCTMPDQDERENILHVLTDHVNLASDVNLTEIAKKTEFFTGADLRGLMCSAQMCNEDDNEESTEDPVISQADLLKVLEHTKPSLSPLDNLKFTQIYADFKNKKGLSSENMQKQKVISA